MGSQEQHYPLIQLKRPLHQRKQLQHLNQPTIQVGATVMGKLKQM